jgi:leucyl/phenylalanyl-tRNA--protein transferase
MNNLTSIRNMARASAFLAGRAVLQRINPAIPNNRFESAFRWLGFFQAPDPAEVIANYLRGYLLFGRKNPYGQWFHWYRLPARAIITAQTAHVPRRQRPLLHRQDLEFRYDQDFELAIRHCQEGRDGWLTEDAIEVYQRMYSLHLIGTVGTYRKGELVGGFWGLSVGRVFAIMSMFHLEKSAGSLALAALTDSLIHGGRWSIIDCGGPGYHWDRYGARNFSVKRFSALVTRQLLDSSVVDGTSNWTQSEPAPTLQSPAECVMAGSSLEV